MAETLKATAGSSLKARFSYLQPGGAFVDTTGSTARLSISAVKPVRRVVLEAEQSAVVGSILQLIEPGHWRVFLSASITKILPPTAVWELELTSNSNPEDVIRLASGVIMTGPEQVKTLE